MSPVRSERDTRGDMDRSGALGDSALTPLAGTNRHAQRRVGQRDLRGAVLLRDHVLGAVAPETGSAARVAGIEHGRSWGLRGHADARAYRSAARTSDEASPFFGRRARVTRDLDAIDLPTSRSGPLASEGTWIRAVQILPTSRSTTSAARSTDESRRTDRRRVVRVAAGAVGRPGGEDASTSRRAVTST